MNITVLQKIPVLSRLTSNSPQVSRETLDISGMVLLQARCSLDAFPNVYYQQYQSTSK